MHARVPLHRLQPPELCPRGHTTNVDFLDDLISSGGSAEHTEHTALLMKAGMFCMTLDGAQSMPSASGYGPPATPAERSFPGTRGSCRAADNKIPKIFSTCALQAVRTPQRGVMWPCLMFWPARRGQPFPGSPTAGKTRTEACKIRSVDAHPTVRDESQPCEQLEVQRKCFAYPHLTERRCSSRLEACAGIQLCRTAVEIFADAASGTSV